MDSAHIEPAADAARTCSERQTEHDAPPSRYLRADGINASKASLISEKERQLVCQQSILREDSPHYGGAARPGLRVVGQFHVTTEFTETTENRFRS